MRLTDLIRWWVATELYEPMVIQPNKHEVEYNQRFIDQIDPVELEAFKLFITEHLMSRGGASVEEAENGLSG